MRKLFFIAGLLLFTSGIARAACDRFEVGGSYDYVRVNTGMTVKGGSGGSSTTIPSLNLSGWNAEVVGNATCWLGIVADFSGVYGTPTVATFPVTTHVYSSVFGPRANWHNMTPFTPFVEGLFGVAHASLSNATQGSFSENAFEGNFGGGVDINLGSHWAIRPKADYVLTKFGSQFQNNATVSVAIVFKLGGS